MTAQLRLFITSEYTCSYLPDRTARNLVADPGAINQQTYSKLARLGFRRSGEYVYQPHCQDCSACRSLRVDCGSFRPNRSQRRNLKRNADLDLKAVPAQFSAEHFELFSRYVNRRHASGGMTDMDSDAYQDFIGAYWSDSWLYEFRAGRRLLCVAVVDSLEDGLSAVYSFYEPAAPQRGLGTFAILMLIEAARRMHKPWVYLGYWIADCDKMAYKNQFQPYQVFTGNAWRSGI